MLMLPRPPGCDRKVTSAEQARAALRALGCDAFDLDTIPDWMVLQVLADLEEGKQ